MARLVPQQTDSFALGGCVASLVTTWECKDIIVDVAMVIFFIGSTSQFYSTENSLL